MKALIVIFAVAVAIYLGLQLLKVWEHTSKPESGSSEPTYAQQTGAAGENLSGLPSYLEASLADAQSKGTEELGKWLNLYRRQIQDPRLAWIELDYVVLLNLKDHEAARREFERVKQRVPPNSPLHERIRKLESAYER